MASDQPTTATSTSSLQKTVCLHRWWLVKAESNSPQGTSLAVAGFPSREQGALRIFSSAPISKRFDVFTLETMDGICIFIQGLIDKARTEANGFSSEIFKHFVYGFPIYWEECAKKYLGVESTTEILPESTSEIEHSNFSSDGLCNPSAINEDSEMDRTCDINTSMEHNSVTPDMNVTVLQSDSEIGVNNHKIKNLISPCNNRVLRSSSKLLGVINDDNLSNKVLENEKSVSVSISKDVSNVETILVDLNLVNDTDNMSSRDNSEQISKGKKAKHNQNLKESNVKKGISEISSHCSGRVLRSSRKLEEVKKDDKVSKKNVESVSINLNLPDKANLQHVNDTITPRNTDNRPSRVSRKGKKTKDNQNHEEIMNESVIRKGMIKAASVIRNSTKSKVKIAINSKESLSGNVYAFKGETKRKLDYETPVSKKAKEKVPINTPESVTFKRSRSGRVLLPILEFWRNQTAVYDTDRKITGIMDGLHTQHSYKGSKSEPPRKRRKHK